MIIKTRHILPEFAIFVIGLRMYVRSWYFLTVPDPPFFGVLYDIGYIYGNEYDNFQTASSIELKLG